MRVETIKIMQFSLINSGSSSFYMANKEIKLHLSNITDFFFKCLKYFIILLWQPKAEEQITVPTT